MNWEVVSLKGWDGVGGGGGVQGSKFKFEFGGTCATRCKFLGALPKF